MIQKKLQSIILFDGICNLCNSSVQFVLRHDKKKKFKFASLQSDAATKLLLQLNHKNNKLESIVLIDDSKIYDKSTAALKIAKELSPLWNFFYVLIIIPKPIRDFVYDLIAKNRYSWFGKKDTCLFYAEGHQDRFIS
jgi:predicted DCC family thiol-disulfide oxidoreductase YuxK